jgi:hypothetical protein
MSTNVLHNAVGVALPRPRNGMPALHTSLVGPRWARGAGGFCGQTGVARFASLGKGGGPPLGMYAEGGGRG